MKFRAPLNVAQTTANGIGSLVGAFLNRDQTAQQAEMQAAPSFAQAAAAQAQARQADAMVGKIGAETEGLQLKNQLQRDRAANAIQAALDLVGAVGPARQALPRYRETGTWGASVENPALAGPPMEGFKAPTSPAQAPAGVNDQMLRAFMAAIGATGLAAVDGGNSTSENLVDAARKILAERTRGDLLGAGPVTPQSVAVAEMAMKGTSPYDFNEYGVGNKYTGAVDVSNPAAQRFGKYRDATTGAQKANATQSLAAAGASNAQAGKYRADTDLTRQQIQQGGKTGQIQIVTGEDGSVQLVNKSTGLARPAVGLDGKPVQSGGKPMNESQAKANLFGARMAEAHKTLTELEAGGTPRPGTIKGIAEGAGRVLGLGTDTMGGTLADIAGSATNWTQSAAQQRVEQARRDFINAVLRRESGAAIAPSEFANADRQYFPQPGDSDAVVAQKQRNRLLAIQGLAAEVPQGRALPSLVEAARGAAGHPGAPAAPTGQRNVTVTY